MSPESPESPEPPPLPRALLNAWPVVVVGTAAWLIAAATIFLVPSLHASRPLGVAGLGVSRLGTSIFVLQLAAARRGARGAQSGLESYLDQK